MINNRQNNNRRRNRTGPRPQGGGGGGGNRPEQGNRIDNRARGNAPQLLEKYKNLARDAQMQGDRVMTEYYLQFADHYFRVLADNRARFEEQQAQRRQPHEMSGEIEGVAMGVEGEPIALPSGHQSRPSGNDGDDMGNDDSVDSMMSEETADDRQRQMRGRVRRPRRDEQDGGDYRESRQDNNRSSARPQSRAEAAPEPIARIDMAALPPAINDTSEAVPASAEGAEAPAPRRRGRPRRVTSEAAEI